MAISKKEKLFWSVIIFLMTFCLFRECVNNNETDKLITDVYTYKDSAKYYTLKVNGMKVEVAHNKSLVLENSTQVKSLLSSMNDTIAKIARKFKSIQSATIINNYTTINADTIQLKGDSIPCDFKPFKVRRDSLYYRFVGTISPKYFSIDTLSIPNKVSLIVGTKKTGFLKRKEERAEIINSNPLVKTTNVGNYVVMSKKKRLGLGASVGYGISGSDFLKLNPYFGISLNYNIIEF